MHAVENSPDDRCEDAGEDRHRHHHQRRLRGRHATDELQEEHGRNHLAGDREAHRGDTDVGQREIALTEQRERNERFGLDPRLPEDEQREHDDAHDDERPDPRRPVVLLTVLDTEHQGGQTDCRQHDSDPVEGVVVLLDLGHEHGREDQADDADGEVDEEDPLPAEVVGQHAAEQRADQRCHTGDGAPDTHCRTTLFGREDARDHGHRLRRDECGSDALQSTRCDQFADRAGEPAPDARGGEHHKAHLVDGLGSVLVAQPARDQQRHSVGQQIRAGHPDDAVDVGIERRTDLRLCDGDDRHVDEDHEEADAQGHERKPRSVGHRLECRSGHEFCTF